MHALLLDFLIEKKFQVDGGRETLSSQNLLALSIVVAHELQVQHGDA